MCRSSQPAGAVHPSGAALVAGALMAALVAGCGSGAPAAAPSSVAASAAPSAASGPSAASDPSAGVAPPSAVGSAPARSLPPRPRELRLDGIDACSLITSGLRSQLTVYSRMNRDPAGDGLRSSDCEWTNFPAHPQLALSVRLVLDRGIESYLDDPQARVTEVSGYSAVDLPGLYPTRDDGCVVRVDVAAGQTLWSGYGSDGRVPGKTYDDMCDTARVAAQSELGQLRSRVR
jgi:hypothetical protein